MQWLVVGLGGIDRALRHRAYRLYVLGGIPSVVGTWMHRVAAGWLTWQLTESGFWLGAIAFADFVPVLLASPIAGVVADRVDRMRIILAVQFVLMALAGTIWGLTVSGLITVEILFLLTLMQGLGNAFAQPVRQAIVVALVPRHDLPAGIALNASIWHGARFVGPALAGVVIVAWGVAPAFLFNALSYAAMIAALLAINLPRRVMLARPLRAVPREIVDGWRYVFAHAGIGTLMLLLGAGSLFARPIPELLPGFAAAVFARDAVGLAWLTSAAGFGAMSAGLMLARRGRMQGLVRLLLANSLALALGIALFVVTDWFWLGVASMVMIGFTLTVTGTGIQTLVLAVADDAIQGRVMSIYGLVWMGAPAVGALTMGTISDVVGLRWPGAVAAVALLGAWVWTQRRRGALETVFETERSQ